MPLSVSKRLYAHRAREPLAAQYYGSEDAGGFDVERSGKNCENEARGGELAEAALDAVKTAHAGVTPADLARTLKVEGRDATVDGMYLRIIIHANEHLGQLSAYARIPTATTEIAAASFWFNRMA